MRKKEMNMNVYEASKKRIAWVFDEFEKICVSFSGGKDSSVLLHMTIDEAKKRNRKIGVMFIDWEIQFGSTIEHVKNMFDKYKEYIEPYWIALPFKTENSVSMYEPEWICWEEGKNWIREKPEWAITDYDYFPFYEYAMTFEEFVPKFGVWYGEEKKAAILIGIRTGESLNRFRAIVRDDKQKYEGVPYTTLIGDQTYNVYPIYDWRTEDIWTYNAKTGAEYNKLYDLMYQAGVPLSAMRVDEPFGEKQRKGLWLYHVIEPETWYKIVERVSGANFGALYIKEKGNILGNRKIEKPVGHTWESYAKLLLDTMPTPTAEHYKNKIAKYIYWCKLHGYPEGIPDEQPNDTGSKDIPSWRRICKILLRNDYWCKGLSFSVQKASNYEKYKELMKKKRNEWGIFGEEDKK